MTDNNDYLYKSQQFAKQAVKFFSDGDWTHLVSVRLETGMYLLHMHCMVRQFLRENRLKNFMNMVHGYTAKAGFTEAQRGDFFGTVAAAVAAGGALSATKYGKAVKKESDEVMAEFLKVFPLDKPTRDLVKHYGELFRSAARKLTYSRDALLPNEVQVLRSFLFNSLVITYACIEEHFIEALDEEFIASYGLINPKQARYIAEFLSVATLTFEQETENA